MWKIVYNLLIHLFLPFFLLYAITNSKIRHNLCERLLPNGVGRNIDEPLWIHAASVGEAAIAETLLLRLAQVPGTGPFVITTNTYYTRDLLRRRVGNIASIHSMPFDLPYSLGRFLGDSRFKALVIVETEIWPNLVWTAMRKGIPVVIVNARISDTTVETYQRFSVFFRTVFSGITRVLAQSDEQARRFVSAGVAPENVLILGNLKYCRELTDGNKVPEKENIVTFGSLKERELPTVLPVLRRLGTSYRGFLFFVAPRELHLVDLLHKELSDSFNVARYSRMGGEGQADVNLVIVDTVGDLLGIYRRSKVAFVGGSLAPYGGQNMLEPLFFGTPVLFGPHVENFKDIALTILDEKAGFLVSSGEELFNQISTLIDNEELRRKTGDLGRRVVERQAEILDRTVSILQEIMAGRNIT
jgi:3-deoxy-D-manno-octulosonic-acid transferase